MFKLFPSATPFEPDSMWGKWLRANRQVLACAWAIGILALLTALGQIYHYYRFKNLTSSWQWLYLPMAGLGVYWYIAQASALAIYDAFLQEVEARRVHQQHVNLTKAKLQVIRQFHQLAGWGLWKGVSILLFGSWALAYTHHEFSRMNLKEPVRLSVQIKKSIENKQHKIAQLATNYCDLYTALRHHQARVTAIKRMITETQKSLQLQWYSFYEGQGARAQLSQAQNHSAQQIRNNNSVFQIIKGQTEVYLFLQNKEAQASDAILAQDDRLLTGFQDVQVRYDQHLNTAQKSVYRDQQKLKDLQKELQHEQRIVEHLMVALVDNQKLRAKLLQKIQRDYGYWWHRKHYEQRLDSIRKAHKKP